MIQENALCVLLGRPPGPVDRQPALSFSAVPPTTPPGLPSELLRRRPDVLQAEPPLTDTAMHWHWVSGYRFLRAGVANGADGFWLHLGSTRCKGTVTDIQGCASSNRAEAELPGFVPGRDAVVVDLQKLVDAVDLEDGVPTDCSSEPAELTCTAPFAALGVDFGSGKVNAPASIFRRGAAQ